MKDNEILNSFGIDLNYLHLSEKSLVIANEEIKDYVLLNVVYYNNEDGEVMVHTDFGDFVITWSSSILLNR